MAETTPNVSDYLKYLPALFQEEIEEDVNENSVEEANGVNVLGQFLLAFEHVLSKKRFDDSSKDSVSLSLAKQPALGDLLNDIHRYFDPATAPAGPLERNTEKQADKENRVGTISAQQADFLPWLASWVGLSLRDDWEVREKAEFIRKIIPLYRLRGTREGLKNLLSIYTENDNIEIYEFPTIPHYFQVRLTLYSSDPEIFGVKEQIARAIIDQEKPAHTYYALRVRSGSTIQIGNRKSSILGVNTLLGSQSGISISENDVV